MARPFTATDDDILNAAGRVIARRGPDGFSITEVAADVGLSRAAIILRFKSTHALKVTLLTRMVEQFAVALKALPQTASGDNVLRLAGFIGGYINGRDNLARFFATYNRNLQHADLLALELQRGRVFREAISRVMPEVAIEHTAAVSTFSAHLTGTIMAWLAEDDEDSRRYLVLRTREWLILAGVKFDEEVVTALLTDAPGTRGDRQRSPARPHKKQVRSLRRPGR